MAENNRNQEQSSTGSTTQQNQGVGQGQTQTTSGQEGQDQNPQDGSQWNNYQTREMSDQGSGEGKPTGPGGE